MANFASAGNAQETAQNDNPIGLYHDAESNTYVGALYPTAADAAVRVGYKLVKAGKAAAEMTEDEIAKVEAAKTAQGASSAK